MTPTANKALEVVKARLTEKIQSPSTPKGLAAYVKSLTAWSNAASKVAGSYSDKLGDMKSSSQNMAALQGKLDALLKSVSEQLAQASDLAGKLK